MGAVYDTIGTTYSRRRRPDPRWAAAVGEALGDARRVVDVGAGAGSYEPAGPEHTVVAVEPSRTMIDQRPPGAAPAVQAVAEALPFPDQSFDATLAVLTTHHWTDIDAGVAELARVARRHVLLTWDAAVFARFWLVAEYVPEVAEREGGLATLDAVLARLPADTTTVTPLPVPADCADAVLGAHWRRPHAYLDPEVQGANSGLALLDHGVLARAVARLAADLDSGAWHDRHGDLLGLDELDLGYRLVTSTTA